MTTFDITRIEETFNLRLPESYRQFVYNYPMDALQGVCDFELLSDASRVMELNHTLRSNPFYQGKPWPDHLFAIGENGCGDYYFIDSKDSSGEILFVDHETMNLEKLATDISTWIPKLLEEKRNEA